MQTNHQRESNLKKLFSTKDMVTWSWRMVNGRLSPFVVVMSAFKNETTMITNITNTLLKTLECCAEY